MGGSSEVLELISQQMETEMIKYIHILIIQNYNFLMLIIYIYFCDYIFCYRYLSLKTSLLIPEMLEHLSRFHAMTAFWLIQVNLHVNEKEVEQNFIPKQYIAVTFPLPKAIPITLRYVKYIRNYNE
jgi:hypothetical protein